MTPKSDLPSAADDPHALDRTTALRLVIVMTRALRSVTAQAQKELKKWGLSPTEFGVLEALHHKGPQPLTALADLVLITGASMTYAVKQLEARGLVRRRPSAEDQRFVFGELTDEGKTLIAKVFPEHAEHLRMGMRGLSRQEKRQAAELLKRLGLGATADLAAV
ncbi:MAG: MarR family transcriptional regulator [Gemmatimonadetes bacterium]|nr:MAG: MarR family transcriptional regulator [Gemmatimonadota bacterium]PHX96678.1 MAG: MarR family transcriptional regulator [Gemmatimonadota bacterium]